jgi:hypothetical protein
MQAIVLRAPETTVDDEHEQAALGLASTEADVGDVVRVGAVSDHLVGCPRGTRENGKIVCHGANLSAPKRGRNGEHAEDMSLAGAAGNLST